jgi:arylsulfatase
MGNVVTLLVLAGCGPLPSGDDTRPDIVLVSIDSLRADHISAYGYHRKTTPNIDDWAAEGLRFARARSASPWTLPSHLTMLTGRWPLEHQVIEDDLALSPDVPLVTEALKAAGYATAGFVSTIYVSGGYGFARGFDHYEDYDIKERENLAHSVRVDRLVDDALAWIKANGEDKPVFLFVHIYDVHYPYAPPEPWNVKFDRAGISDELKYRNYKYYQRRPLTKKRMSHQVAQYDESLAWVDDELGRLRGAWRWPRKQPYWIVTADHGEEFGERGSWGHGHTLYREVLEIPLVITGPGLAPAVRDELVGTVDLAATIAGFAGISFPTSGVDLRSAVPERTFYAETSRFDSARLSVQRDDQRLDIDLAHDKRERFDLARDPKEKQAIEGPTDGLEAALWDHLPSGWTADAGTVRTSGWAWTKGGPWSKELVGPTTFGVYPPDAEVSLDGGVRTRGLVSAPAEGALRYTGPRTAVGITLDDKTRAMLEALGYVQEGSEGEGGEPTAEGEEAAGEAGEPAKEGPE